MELRIVPDARPANVLPLNVEPRFLGLTESAGYTGLSRSYLHQQIMAGSLPAFRVGRRLLIAIDDLETFVRRVPA